MIFAFSIKYTFAIINDNFGYIVTFMTKHKMNTIVVTVKFPEELTQGTSDSFFNPLARPLRRVLENGI